MRLRTVGWRAHNPRWAFQPTSGEGAARHGGRFNRIGRAALYLSRRFETAWLEAQQAFAFKPQPLTLCAYDVDCEDIVDLTDDAGRAAAGTDLASLACAWEYLAHERETPPSWTLAEDLIGRGHAGALVPSFAPGAGHADVNIVFWSWGDGPPHQVRTIDDAGRLPRNDISWR